MVYNKYDDVRLKDGGGDIKREQVVLSRLKRHFPLKSME